MNEAAHMNETWMDVSDWQDTLFTWPFFKQEVKLILLDFSQKVHLHGPAENVDVVTLDGNVAKLLDFSKHEDRPLVVNFGSCTWPPFMAKFGEFCNVASSFAPVADFVTVYIEEAHAADGWAFNNNVSINKHCQIEDRISAAKRLLEHKPTFPIVCDGMNEEANFTYGGLYERLYIIHRGKIAYQGGRGPRLYFLKEVVEWLENYRSLEKAKESPKQSALQVAAA